MVLECSDTRDKAKFVLRFLLSGEKTKMQIISAVLDKFLDDAYLGHIMADLEAEGYVDNALGKWKLTGKGERYVHSYDNMVKECIETYPCRPVPKVDKLKLLELKLQSRSIRWNMISTIITLISALLGLIYFLYG